MPPTIHPFPELRALAEQYAQERADARSRYGYTTATGGASWAAMGQVSRDIAVSVELNLLCDLRRPASQDAVCRLVAERVGWDGFDVTKSIEVSAGMLDGLRRAVGLSELPRWEPVPGPAEALSMIVTHLWPSEP